MWKAKNWDSFQSFRDRNPPWIRLHKRLIDDIRFQRMSVNARALLPMLWLLISEDKDPASGMLRMDAEEIAFRLRQPEKDITSGIAEIVKSDFMEEILEDKTTCYNSVTDLLRNCYPETESDTEAVPEAEAVPETSPEAEAEVMSAFRFYNYQAEQLGLVKAQVFSTKRKSNLRQRLQECGGLEGWKRAIAKVRESPFLRGDNKQGWKADFDFIVTKSKFHKILEGSYDEKQRPDPKKQQIQEMHQNGW